MTEQRSIFHYPELKGPIGRVLGYQTMASHRGLPPHIRQSPRCPAITATPSRAAGRSEPVSSTTNPGSRSSSATDAPDARVPQGAMQPSGSMPTPWLLSNSLVCLLGGGITHLRPKTMVFPWTHVALAS